jgi:hypothetical protein
VRNTTWILVFAAALGIAGCAHQTVQSPAPAGWVTEQGGAVESDDGRVLVEVPAGAVSALTKVVIHPEKMSPSEITARAIIANTTYFVGPENTEFLKPVRITITLADIPSGVDRDWLRLVAVAAESTLGIAAAPNPRANLEATPPTMRGESARAAIYAIADLRAVEGATQSIDLEVQRKLDMLFVLDNTNPLHEDLVRHAPDLFRPMLSSFSESGPLDLQIGVVTTDMGAGNSSSDRCTPGTGIDDHGDSYELQHGRLQNEPRGDSCAQARLLNPEDRFLTYREDSSGVTQNFSGELEDAFACYAKVGTDGCGYVQPLAAMEAALATCNYPPSSSCDAEFTDCECAARGNRGFLRPDASLAVFILSGEDDCSVPPNSTLFDPNDTSLGPLTDHHAYRCFRWGVLCDEKDPGDSSGERAACKAGSIDFDAPKLVPVEDYARFLNDLKTYSDQVSLVVYAGRPGTIAVTPDDAGNPTLAPACTPVELPPVYPGIRLHSFASLFGDGVQSVCPDGLKNLSMTVTLDPVWCLRDQDLDLVSHDVIDDYDCVASSEDRTTIPPCSRAEGTCVTVSYTTHCSGPALRIHRRDDGLPIGQSVTLRCRTPEAT